VLGLLGLPSMAAVCLLTGCSSSNAQETPQVPVSASASASPAPVSDAPFTDASADEVESQVSRTNSLLQADGWMIGVWDPSRGELELASGTADPDASFRIGGITQSMTATAVLRLVDQGLIGLDDPVNRYVPNLPEGDQVTIRQLLCMETDFAPLTSDEKFTEAYAENPDMPWRVEDSLDLIRTDEQADGADNSAKFSATNYIVLGAVLEAVSGKPAAEVLLEQVARPAGLVSTVFPTSAELPNPAIPGAFRLDGEQRRSDLINPTIPFTSGFAISTMADLRTWGQTLASGALLSPQLASLQRPTPGDPESSYGLGISEFGGWIGHSGYIWGYATAMFVEPETGATVIAFTAGGPPENEAAKISLAQTIATLWPGQYPQIDTAAYAGVQYLAETRGDDT